MIFNINGLQCPALYTREALFIHTARRNMAAECDARHPFSLSDTPSSQTFSNDKADVCVCIESKVKGPRAHVDGTTNQRRSKKNDI